MWIQNYKETTKDIKEITTYSTNGWCFLSLSLVVQEFSIEFRDK